MKSQEEIKVRGWLARGENNLRLYRKKPYKTANRTVWGGGSYVTLPKDGFLWISWDDPEPVECEVTVRVKKDTGRRSGIKGLILRIKRWKILF